MLFCVVLVGHVVCVVDGVDGCGACDLILCLVLMGFSWCVWFRVCCCGVLLCCCVRLVMCVVAVVVVDVLCCLSCDVLFLRWLVLFCCV